MTRQRKMSPPDSDTRKRWWLLCYALTAMQKASHTAQQLISVCKSNRDPLFLPLAVAVHAFYARPFSDNRGVGRIGEDVVPPDRIGLHKWLMAFRMKAYCHTDSTKIHDFSEVWNDVVFEIDGGIKKINTKTPCAQVEDYIYAVEHCEVMDRVFFREIHQLNEIYRDLIPSDTGNYELRVDMPGEQLFIPYTPTQRVALNFKGKCERKEASFDRSVEASHG